MNKVFQNEIAPAPASRYSETCRASFSTFAHHGKPMRGLMSTPKSPNFQGRFGRMFRCLPSATYGKTDDESRQALMTLGSAMTATPLDLPKDGFRRRRERHPRAVHLFRPVRRS